MIYASICPRRGTLEEWSTENPILDQGEMAIEYPSAGIGTGLCKIKLGDGVSHYNDLAYAFNNEQSGDVNGGTATKVDDVIAIRSSTALQWEEANPTLKNQELAFDSTNLAIKVGDGTTAWNDLPYINAWSSLVNEFDFGDEG